MRSIKRVLDTAVAGYMFLVYGIPVEELVGYWAWQRLAMPLMMARVESWLYREH